MPKLVDTTIRLLSQEPLAGKVPTGEVLRIGEILDKAGFACLEVSGGGVFDAAVHRAVESPWERIRALDARTRHRSASPSAAASSSARSRSARMWSGASSRAPRRTVSTSSDSTTRSTTYRTFARRVRRSSRAGKMFHAGLVFSSGKTGAVDTLVEQAKRIPELGRHAGRAQRPDRRAQAAPHRGARPADRGGDRLPVGLYVQGAAGTGLSTPSSPRESGPISSPLPSTLSR